MPDPLVRKNEGTEESMLIRVSVETSELANVIAKKNDTTKKDLIRFLVELARDCGLPHLEKMAKKEEGSG